MSKKDLIRLESLPKHIAIIMDGNWRWAKQRGHMRIFGHESGVNAVREVAEAAAELGIKYLTLYAFSTENWARPKDEVEALMRLLVQTINQETKTLNDNKIRLHAIGDVNSLPTDCKEQLMETINATASNDRLMLILALSYSSRWEMTEAVKQIVRKANQGELTENDITAEMFETYLNTSGIPDPEMVIRTSGEYRISNFLLWQLAYSELFFPAKLWPDFKKEDLYEAIVDYQHRERRFGKTSEQIIKGADTE
jgi:undecaprenyl diphosphate synthase